MGETYGLDDSWNMVADHVLRALQQDAILQPGGPLAIETWEQELPEDAGVYQTNLLPAVAVEVEEWAGESTQANPELCDHTWQVTVAVVTGGGVLETVTADTKRYVAHLLDVLAIQHLAERQLDGLPAALEGAEPGSVRVTVFDATATAGPAETGAGLRGVGHIRGAVTVGVVVPTD